MSEAKIKVPEGMQLAFVKAMQDRFGSVPGGTAVGLEAALRWLSENPIEPPIEQIESMYIAIKKPTGVHGYIKVGALEWQRRMFSALESDEETAK